MYNFLVYICKNHSTTYKLIIIFLFHSVKQINYSYWKTCESSRLVKYTYNIDQISSTTEFQSTASSQKATWGYFCVSWHGFDFNPQLPRRKRHGKRRIIAGHRNFNPQLPRRKRRSYFPQPSSSYKFQSTASSQKATANMHNHSLHTCINHSNTHKIIILSASIAVNPIKISNFTSANLPTFYVHF